MKRKLSNLLVAVFVLLTLALIWAGAGYAFDKLPIRYCILFGILWESLFVILVFWEEK